MRKIWREIQQEIQVGGRAGRAYPVRGTGGAKRDVVRFVHETLAHEVDGSRKVAGLRGQIRQVEIERPIGGIKM